LTPEMHNRTIVDAAFKQAGLTIKPVIETNSILTLGLTVLVGEISSILPGTLIGVLRGVRFKVMCCRVRGIHLSERPEMTTKSKMTDDELLLRLSSHPEIRERISSLLAAVDDTAGDLKLADDAELRLTQELQRMGQEAMQAWANVQVNATEQDVRHTGRAHREGKKNSAGTPHLVT